jgi:hypothetical protein
MPDRVAEPIHRIMKIDTTTRKKAGIVAVLGIPSAFVDPMRESAP